MRKLKLDLEHLAVDSFATASDGERWGTVRAASDEMVEEPGVGEEVGFLSWFTCQTRCNQNTCGGPCGQLRHQRRPHLRLLLRHPLPRQLRVRCGGDTGWKRERPVSDHGPLRMRSFGVYSPCVRNALPSIPGSPQ